METIEETTILLIPSTTFRRLVDTHPAVAMDLFGHFARRLRSFTELVEQISMQTVQQRVARYLYLASREEGHTTPEGVVVNRSITLQDLAALVGSVREVVSRTLHIMETDGLVEVRRKEIVIRDVAGLAILHRGAGSGGRRRHSRLLAPYPQHRRLVLRVKLPREASAFEFGVKQ